MIETLAASVDQLLDGEQGDQCARNWDCRIKRSDRRQRRHPEAREAAQKILISKVDKTESNPENHKANDDLGDDTRGPMQRFGDGREKEMIVAPRRHGGADE